MEYSEAMKTPTGKLEKVYSWFFPARQAEQLSAAILQKYEISSSRAAEILLFFLPCGELSEIREAGMVTVKRILLDNGLLKRTPNRKREERIHYGVSEKFVYAVARAIIGRLFFERWIPLSPFHLTFASPKI